MGDWITNTIIAGGPAGVFLLMLLETVFPPIPSELVMPLTGYLASQGHMGLVAAIVAGTLGSTLGALLFYWLGLRLGEERLKAFADRHGRWLTVSRADLDRAGRWFDRHGGRAVLLGRLVPGVRSLISLPAGIHRMPMPRFVACTIAGSAAWTTLLVGLGYTLGRNFERVGDYVDPVGKLVLGIVLALYLWRVARGKGKPAQV